MVYKKDELVFLGSGGGRHHIRTQFRATGGIIYKFNGIQSHIDPGPGATVRINQFKEDPLKTELFIVTHAHIDHMNDLSVIIESSREILHDRKYNYYKKLFEDKWKVAISVGDLDSADPRLAKYDFIVCTSYSFFTYL